MIENWTECTSDNLEFTEGYDRACREIRRVLGSYDHIAHLIYAATRESVAGVTVRRWMLNRNMPITFACTLLDLANAVADESGDAFESDIFDLFPYLYNYTGEDNDNGEDFLE